MSTVTAGQLSLAPLGAGDLIDRTVRLYRRHFMVLVRASVPPVIVSGVGTVLWSIGVRSVAVTGSEGRLVVYLLMAAVGLLISFAGFIGQLIVMGGASRTLVMHLLRGEPVTTRAIYRNVRERFWGLLGATLAVVFCLGFAGGVTFFAWYLLVLVVVIAGVFVAQAVPIWIAAFVGLVFFFASAIGALYLFFLIAGRVAYVPQVLTVEGRGVFASISRSAQLARGNVRRLMALFLFIVFATYSALMLLLVPLGWIGYLNGVDPFVLDATRWPAWYAIGYEVVAQLSAILLAPVWMLGLSLLYVDERVRHEGYDVELLAAMRLGEMPSLPQGTSGPLTPAVASPQIRKAEGPAPSPPGRAGSTLGLS